MCIFFPDAYSGGSADWARGVAEITYSYGVELRDKGWHGFLLPANQIVPTGEEIFAGLKVLGKRLIEQYKGKPASLHSSSSNLVPLAYYVFLVGISISVIIQQRLV